MTERKRPPSQQGMVRWPEPGSGWDDTGEGGLLVWAVVTEEDAAEASCFVFGDTDLHISEPDVPLHDTGSPTWESDLWRERGMPTHGSPETEWPLQSGALAAAVLLGTTEHSWTREAGSGDYFTVRGPEDLTEEGQQLVRLLEQVTGGKVRLLTMLDT